MTARDNLVGARLGWGGEKCLADSRRRAYNRSQFPDLGSPKESGGQTINLTIDDREGAMNRRTRWVLALVAGAWLASAQNSAAQGSFLGPLKTQWENIAKMVMGIAEIIPEDKYDYKPTPEVRSFREQLQHLVFENYNFMGAVAGDPPPDRSKFEALKTRAELLQALKESYDYGAKVWAGLNEQKAMETITFRNTQTARWVPVLSNIADNMDHYGNLVVYVRLNGLVPPRITPQQRFASG
ncbi:MAG: hypothetical protein A3G20_09370 [Acidobacteria bacterium RIFCSPLOWO2_12_FULL_59_11]|nr:MAG: hypothetical protein A3G20_09370 [Acidobacteria bacterium RIFCSPLOWO2_12_FULL_59_11]